MDLSSLGCIVPEILKSTKKIWEAHILLIDSHSKWLEIVQTSVSTSHTIQALRKIFATHGLPEIGVSDDAAAFLSDEFASFISKNDIYHISTAPFYPSSNGMAERAVQTYKRGMEKIPGDQIDIKLQRFLFSYRTTPHSLTILFAKERWVRTTSNKQTLYQQYQVFKG